MQALRLENASLATSGTYRQHFEHEGKSYAHVLDPRTGRPVEHALRSVSVKHASAALADGYATALLVLGQGRGREVAARLGLNVLWVE
jgi:thiamine biosynthesis lipoprotein